MHSPKVSFIVPLYNGSRTIRRALNCLVRQSVPDWEAIVIDDGSEDGSFSRACSVRDKRIKVYRNEQNMGVAAVRNQGLDLARGEFIASMDADDTCHRKRIEWTLAAFEANPDAGICGGWMRVFRSGTIPFVMRQPCSAAAVEAMRLFGNPFWYGATMLRKDIVDQHGLRYNAAYTTGEDYDFGERLMECSKGVNIPYVIYGYHVHRTGLTENANPQSMQRRIRVIRPRLQRLLSREVNGDEVSAHVKLGYGEGVNRVADLQWIRAWIDALIASNVKTRLFDVDGLAESAATLWFRVCRNSANVGPLAWKIWREARFSHCYTPSMLEYTGFAMSIVKSKSLVLLTGSQAGWPE